VRRKVPLSILAVALCAGGIAIAWAIAGPSEQSRGGSAPELAAAGGSLKIDNSKEGRAVFSADDMAPGSPVTGQVRIANPNVIPFRMVLTGDRPAPGPLGEAISMTVKSSGGGAKTIYSGPMSEFSRQALGTFQPGEKRTYRFSATLPRGTGNDLQGESTGIDLTWTATANAPPEPCRLRAARSRFFIFRSRPVMRLVTRYRANEPGELRVVFFERMGIDRLGPKVGQMTTHFERSVETWRMNRVRRRMPERLLERLRTEPNGFIARIYIHQAPAYCARRLNLILSDLRRVDRQFVWFQRGTFRTIR